jgi:hypothetical protein
MDSKLKRIMTEHPRPNTGHADHAGDGRLRHAAARRGHDEPRAVGPFRRRSVYFISDSPYRAGIYRHRVFVLRGAWPTLRPAVRHDGAADARRLRDDAAGGHDGAALRRWWSGSAQPTAAAPRHRPPTPRRMREPTQLPVLEMSSASTVLLLEFHRTPSFILHPKSAGCLHA